MDEVELVVHMARYHPPHDSGDLVEVHREDHVVEAVVVPHLHGVDGRVTVHWGVEGQ